MKKCHCGEKLEFDYIKPYICGLKVSIFFKCSNGHRYGKVRIATDAEIRHLPLFNLLTQ